jgi:uncharacterized membrane protein
MSATHPTGTGLEPNVAGALSYLVMPITGIIFLVVERESRYVRFHAAQATVVGAAFIVANVAFGVFSSILSAIPLIGWVIVLFGFLAWAAIGLAGFGLWLYLMFQAYQGNEWEVPIAAEYARRIAAVRPAL